MDRNDLKRWHHELEGQIEKLNQRIAVLKAEEAALSAKVESLRNALRKIIETVGKD